MKLNKVEKSWILYDVANSAFTLIMSATIPIYFAALYNDAITGVPATTFFGFSTSISVAIIALLSPFMGAVADHKGLKKKLFVGSILIGVLGGLAFTAISNWIFFLVLFIISRVGYSFANVFYDSMLTDVTTNEKMDSVSAYGYAFGYIGSTIPFIMGIILITFYKSIGISEGQATQLSFLIALAWWILFTIPLLRNVKQTYYTESEPHLLANSFKRVGQTFNKIRKNRALFFYIIAYFFYIDGVYTIISMASSFGKELKLETTGLIAALLLTQFIAFPFAIFAGMLAKKYKVLSLLKIYICIYGFVAVFGFFLREMWQFWVLAIIVGLAQGGVQSLSRSYFGKLVPKENSNEYFGFFDIFGKYADLLGPILIGFSGLFLGSSRYAILFLVVFFIIGFVLLTKVENIIKKEKAS